MRVTGNRGRQRWEASKIGGQGGMQQYEMSTVCRNRTSVTTFSNNFV